MSLVLLKSSKSKNLRTEEFSAEIKITKNISFILNKKIDGFYFITRYRNRIKIVLK